MRTKLIHTVFLLLVFSFLGNAQIKWQLKPYQAVGYASNILLAPAVLANPGIDTIGKFAIYERDVFNKIGLNNRLEKRAENGALFSWNTVLQTINYATVENVDSYIIRNTVDYKFDVDTNFTFIPRVGIEKTKKLTFDFLTDDGMNTYDYWNFFVGSEAYYRLNKKLRFGLDLETGRKSFKTAANGRDFTHMQYLFKFETEFWINKLSYLNVGYNYRRCDFESFMSEFLPNTLIDWSYNSVFTSIKYKLDDDHYFLFVTELEQKSDRNKADFSFSQWNNKLVWDWYVNKIGLYGELQANLRNYKRRTAYTEANTDLDNALLKYNYYTANFKLKYNWSSNSMIYAGFSREIRETNSSRLERFNRRPYAFFGFTMGWSYTMNKEVERNLPTEN
jgi:hypothetical protein